jgi:hypothetical protein
MLKNADNAHFSEKGQKCGKFAKKKADKMRSAFPPVETQFFLFIKKTYNGGKIYYVMI